MDMIWRMGVDQSPGESRSGGATSEARRPGAEGLPRAIARSRPSHRPTPRYVRRRFTTAYKLEILRKADACARPGELGPCCDAKGFTRRIW